jgi:superfamily I DNA/RNA helicase
LRGQELVDALFPGGDPELLDVRLVALEVLGENGDDLSPQTLFEDIGPKIYSPEPPLDSDVVRVMSIHKAKGLTVNTVFMVGCNRGYLPTEDRDLQGEPARKKEEEQRRLFYVGMTRCEKSLVMSSFIWMPFADVPSTRIYHSEVRNQMARCEPSVFLNELGPTAPRPIVGSVLVERWATAADE